MTRSKIFLITNKFLRTIYKRTIMRKLDGQISMVTGGYERDVGHLYSLLTQGIKLVDDSIFHCGQGDSPSEDEQEAMQDAEAELMKVAKEIFLGLTGKKLLKHDGDLPAPTLERICTAHSYLGPNWLSETGILASELGNKHSQYRQDNTEACYICTLLRLVEAQQQAYEQQAQYVLKLKTACKLANDVIERLTVPGGRMKVIEDLLNPEINEQPIC